MDFASMVAALFNKQQPQSDHHKTFCIPKALEFLEKDYAAGMVDVTPEKLEELKQYIRDTPRVCHEIVATRILLDGLKKQQEQAESAPDPVDLAARASSFE